MKGTSTPKLFYQTSSPTMNKENNSKQSKENRRKRYLGRRCRQDARRPRLDRSPERHKMEIPPKCAEPNWNRALSKVQNRKIWVYCFRRRGHCRVWYRDGGRAVHANTEDPSPTDCTIETSPINDKTKVWKERGESGGKKEITKAAILIS